MKITVLVVALVLGIFSSVVLGFHWSGGTSNGWQNEPGGGLSATIDATIGFNVYQWCDVYLYEEITEISIQDSGTYIYDPDSLISGGRPQFIAKVLFRTNAKTLKISVDATMSGNVQTNEDLFDLFDVQWTIYVYDPRDAGGYYPHDNNDKPLWENLKGEVTIEDRSGSLLINDSNNWPNFGLGFKFVVDKNLPAGRYKFTYYVYLSPTVSF